MRIVEKKCPGCGANIKFNENDSKITCEYCKKELLIEKDPKEEYLLTLNEIQKKVFNRVSVMHKVISIIAIIIFLTIFGIIIYGFAFSGKNKPLTDINNISNSNYGFIDNHSSMAIDDLTFGDSDFVQTGKESRVKEYLLVGDNDSIYIPVYKVTYTDFPKHEVKYTLFIPVKYENIISDGKDIDVFELGDGIIDCEDYYFNLEHSSSSKGYQSIDDVYNKYIKSIGKGYKIIKK